MNKSLLRLIKIIQKNKNVNTCIKELNLNYDSCFLCFIKILENAILEYKEFVDYEYLINTSKYLEKVYEKLTIKKQKEYKDLIYKMRKVYKRQIQNIDETNKKYFETTIYNLNELINNIDNKDNIVVFENNKEKKNNDYIITIDDTNTKILDDGLSITLLPNNNLLFKVHIADPLVIYPYESDIMKNAKLNIRTFNKGNSDIPMIPNELSLDKLSLIKHKNRYVKSFCYEFDRSGKIVDFYIVNDVIKVNERHSYNSINNLYKNGGRNNKEDKMLSYYDELVKYLRVMFKNVRDYEKIKVNNFVLDDVKISSFAERLVTYSMVLTGYMTAKYMNEKDFPFAYRCNKLAMIDDDVKQGLSYDDILKLEMVLSKSYYTPNNIGHEKLQLDTYSHVTSPLRRFIDDLNMHALNICYFNKPNDKEIYYLQDEIKNTCNYVNKELDEKIKKIIR